VTIAAVKSLTPTVLLSFGRDRGILPHRADAEFSQLGFEYGGVFQHRQIDHDFLTDHETLDLSFCDSQRHVPPG
jgi:hypothetical protein